MQPAATVYTAAQRILVVGDGDFSFCAGLVKHTGGVGGNIVATSLDTRSECVKKYGSSVRALFQKEASHRMLGWRPEEGNPEPLRLPGTLPT